MKGGACRAEAAGFERHNDTFDPHTRMAALRSGFPIILDRYWAALVIGLAASLCTRCIRCDPLMMASRILESACHAPVHEMRLALAWRAAHPPEEIAITQSLFAPLQARVCHLPAGAGGAKWA